MGQSNGKPVVFTDQGAFVFEVLHSSAMTPAAFEQHLPCLTAKPE